ncbi:Helix-turn-helix [Lachnospiraceae bacterium NE2001]|nr:Helix-turn-helix [Lachnospiraceae bacterium NE2001]
MDNYKLENASKYFEKIDNDTKKALAIEGFLTEVGCIFIKYRLMNEMSQKELAEKLGVSQAMVSKLESGEYNPTIKKLCELFQKLDLEMKLSVSELQKDEPIGLCDLVHK